jgi:hypothetical protein
MDNPCNSQVVNPSRVSFDRIFIREFEITLGDHPDTTAGPPVTLSWHHKESYEMSIDDWESGKIKRRLGYELRLPANVRRRWLLEDKNIDEAMIRATMKEVTRSKSQRCMTFALLDTGVENWQVVCESTLRKLNRLRKKTIVSSRQKEDPAAVWLQTQPQANKTRNKLF